MNGTLAEFLAVYDQTWGRFQSITQPTVGNHEYGTPGASGYFTYFGSSAGPSGTGYYSYDVGAWHVVVLNSMCGAVGGCSTGSAQEEWLRTDLAASSATCTLAYWHHPRFSSGSHGSAPELEPLWQALYAEGADVVLNGHDHDYERFAPQSPTGAGDPLGLREFVVGTGGANLVPLEAPIANSEVRSASTFGVLQLTLHASSYDWAFLPETAGGFTDTGQASCH